MLIFYTSLVCIVISTNPFIRCGYVAHQEELYFFASFDRNRFEQPLGNLHGGFDSCEYRNTDDKSATFRQMWEQFFENYRKHYAVSAYITVYEQLSSFLGR